MPSSNEKRDKKARATEQTKHATDTNSSASTQGSTRQPRQRGRSAPASRPAPPQSSGGRVSRGGRSAKTAQSTGAATPEPTPAIDEQTAAPIPVPAERVEPAPEPDRQPVEPVPPVEASMEHAPEPDRQPVEPVPPVEVSMEHAPEPDRQPVEPVPPVGASMEHAPELGDQSAEPVPPVETSMEHAPESGDQSAEPPLLVDESVEHVQGMSGQPIEHLQETEHPSVVAPIVEPVLPPAEDALDQVQLGIDQPTAAGYSPIEENMQAAQGTAEQAGKEEEGLSKLPMDSLPGTTDESIEPVQETADQTRAVAESDNVLATEQVQFIAEYMQQQTQEAVASDTEQGESPIKRVTGQLSQQPDATLTATESHRESPTQELDVDIPEGFIGERGAQTTATFSHSARSAEISPRTGYLPLERGSSRDDGFEGRLSFLHNRRTRVAFVLVVVLVLYLLLNRRKFVRS